MTEFRMPSLGADMETGTIVEWRVQPGDTVHRGDIIAVVDTEKSTIEIEVFTDGVIEELTVEPGVEIPVGTVLAHITTADTATSARPAPGLESKAFVRASPLARKEAAAHGVDLRAVPGTGPGGAVVVRDLPSGQEDLRAAARPKPAPQPPAPARGVTQRSATARLMARSSREIPHYYLATTIELGAALGWLREQNSSRAVGDRLLPAALLCKATAVAARHVPMMNGFWNEGFQSTDAVHLGIAVSLRGGGLVAPAIHDADQLDLTLLMQRMRDLVQRARSGRLRSSEMSDPTITVTNLGDQGVEEVFGVIYPPQVALVGFGRIVDRPWAADGMIGVRPLVRATLAADHRASEGHEGARFLARIDRLLQSPEDL